MSSRSIRQASVLRRSSLALALAIGLGGSGLVVAQSTVGSIFGSATPGQTVTATSSSGVTRTVTVDQSGRYTISSLPVGTYNVSVSSGGATVSTRENVGIRVGSGTEVSFNNPASAGAAQDLSGVTVSANALPSIDVTGVDKSAIERLLLLADFSITLNGVFNDAANQSHDVFKTVPSTSVARTTTLTVSGQTLAAECLYTDYPLTRAQDGSLTYAVPGVLADGTVPTWA